MFFQNHDCILAELTFKVWYIELIITISPPLHNDWPIVQNSYLILTFQTCHFFPELLPTLHWFKAEILINKNIATFQFLHALIVIRNGKIVWKVVWIDHFFVTERKFPNILVHRLPQNISNVNTGCAGKPKQLYSFLW